MWRDMLHTETKLSQSANVPSPPKHANVYVYIDYKDTKQLGQESYRSKEDGQEGDERPEGRDWDTV